MTQGCYQYRLAAVYILYGQSRLDLRKPKRFRPDGACEVRCVGGCSTLLQRYSPVLSLTSALDGGGWSMPRSGHFTPGKDPVSIVKEAGWASEPVWTGAENLAPTGMRSPNRPARSESLRYTDYAIPAHSILLQIFHNHLPVSFDAICYNFCH